MLRFWENLTWGKGGCERWAKFLSNVKDRRKTFQLQSPLTSERDMQPLLDTIRKSYYHVSCWLCHCKGCRGVFLSTAHRAGPLMVMTYCVWRPVVVPVSGGQEPSVVFCPREGQDE